MRPYTHLTLTDRLRIEKWLQEGCGVCEIARLLNKHRNTISRELKRGEYLRLNGSTWENKTAYSPDIAEARYRGFLEEKGPKLKIGADIDLANLLEALMLGDGEGAKRCSPAAAIAIARGRGYTVSFSEVTLYSYISKGIFFRLTNKDLIEKGKKKRGYKRVAVKRPPAGESIEKRPEYINRNEEYGHWEMDSVIGAKGKGPCLVTMTERKSLMEMAFLVEDHTAASVVGVLDCLERRMGKDRFRKLFKTITVDNGSEFALCKEMEQSSIDKGRRTKFYYCHPYSSWERGRNENQNRMLRRFFPKGMSLKDVTQEEVDEACRWINAYPRGSLGWRCSKELFEMAA